MQQKPAPGTCSRTPHGSWSAGITWERRSKLSVDPQEGRLGKATLITDRFTPVGR